MFNKYFLFIFSFLGGIFYHSIFLYSSISQNIFYLAICIAGLMFIVGSQYGRTFGITIILFLLGFLYFHNTLDFSQKNELHYFAQENIEIPLVGNIVQKPEIKGQQQELVVDVKGLITGGTIEPVKTRMLVKTYDTKIYHYGEKIKFTTTPQIPESFVGDTDRVFDYEHFLEKDSIYYTGKSADITIIENARTSVLGSLYSLKSALIKKMYEYIPRPESSLLIGVLLGEKTALGDKLENDFRTTGLMHIVVLSGYNVSLVIFAVMLLLRFLPLYTRSVIAILGIIGFALLVGAGPTVIRASIMALFIVLGQMVGRQYHVERALVIAGLLMVLYNPWILFFDISFQFSFLATYGLIVLSPYLEKFFSRVPKKLLLQESAVATTAAQIMVAPLILYYIGDFSIISIVVNMLVLFMVPVSMLLGFLMAVFGFIFPPLASLLAVPTLYSLKYILFIVDVFADIPFAKITFPKFSFLWVLVWYGLVFIFVRRGSKKSVLPK